MVTSVDLGVKTSISDKDKRLIHDLLELLAHHYSFPAALSDANHVCSPPDVSDGFIMCLRGFWLRFVLMMVERSGVIWKITVLPRYYCVLEEKHSTLGFYL